MHIFLSCCFIVIFTGYWVLSRLKPKIKNIFIFVNFFICLYQYFNHMVSFFSFFRFAGVFCGNNNYNINLFNKMHTGIYRFIIKNKILFQIINDKVRNNIAQKLLLTDIRICFKSNNFRYPIKD